MAEMHKRCEQPVDEHQLVLRASAHGSLALPGGKPGLVPFTPQRAYFRYEFGDHPGRQTCDPSVADDRCTSRVSHHTPMINDQWIDVSPLTVHELVRHALARRSTATAM
ncbi:hypothetical protein OHB25_11555 [Streptomyces mirabilis]|uniref:hypothetical protein n=1 Tax=Streptomyces TaxID=1883 RepID=UPI001F081BEE|nr:MULTISPECIES: hypothetical protein [Streptomyces]MCX4614359.1 hypothetical protein [Streptomyces mirabilis]MCX5354471.1 hypothetical protein [Streptomyces mirabilis]